VIAPTSASARRGAAQLAAAGAGFALVELLGHHLPPGYSTPQVVFCRYAAHLLFLLLLPGRRAEVWRTRRPGLQALSSLSMLAMPACFVAGVKTLGVENTWAVFWCSPLVALGLGAAFLKEQPSPGTWAFALLALAGSLLVFGEAPRGPALALLWPLGMAFCFALYLVLARLMHEESTESKLFYVAAGVLLSLAPVVQREFVLPDLRAALGLGAIGLVGLASLYLIDRALESGPLPGLVPFTFAAVPCLVGLGALFGEGLGRRATLGSLVVAVALVALVRRAEP
jgi:drug/metabolite transporter (DMT)-like permease